MSEPRNTLSITVGRFLFEFTTFTKWVNKASSWFRPYRGHSTICIDTHGRVCMTGAEFMRAERESAYPIKVFLCNPEPKGGGA